MKVRVKKLPSQVMAYGGRVFNQVAPNALPDRTSEPDHAIKKVIKPVPRDEANIEAEKGETAFFLDVDGLPAHYKIGGKRHTNGGTPLDVPEDTFIFSDTKSMTIKDPKILSFFGETKPKTPAKIAEKYDLNQYRKVLSDKTTDKLQKQTAEKMIENYTMILGKLALVQESMKGFPQGIPMIAQPYMIMNNIKPEYILPQSKKNSQEQMPQGSEEEMMEGAASNPQEEMMEAPPQEMIQQPPMGRYGMQFAPGGPYTGDPMNVRVRSKDTMYTSDNRNQYTNASVIQNLNNPYDTTRDFTREGRLGSVNYFNYPGTADLTWHGPFGGRHEMVSNNPLVNFAAESFVNPAVDSYAGYTNPGATPFSTLKKFVTSGGRPYGNYAMGGSTTRKVRIKSMPKPLYKMAVGGPGPIDGSTIVEELGDGRTLIEHKGVYYVFDDNTGTALSEGTSADNAKRAYLGQPTSSANKPNSTNTGNTGNTGNKGNTGNTGNTNKGTSTSGSTGRGGRMDYMKYNQAMWDEYSKLAEEGKILPDVPQINFESEEDRKRNTVQGERPGNPNVYGDRDWNKGQEFEDFKRRQKWFFDQNPNFNPNKRADVEKFQNEYCKRSAQFGMKNCHFLSKGPSGTGYDGKFGEHTWSAPGFNEAPAQEEKPKPVLPPAENKPQPPIQPNELQQPAIPNRGLEFYPQDLANMMGVLSHQIYKPSTWRPPMLFTTPDVAYVTPDYSPIMEAANISTQGINAYGSRQSADASLSKIQGNSARGAADHNLQVANINAGVFNNWQQSLANIVNANIQYNQSKKEEAYDASQAYKADFIAARNAKLDDMINMGNTALTNAVETYNLNQLYPHYQISPGTGGTAYFDRGEILKAQKNANYSKKLQEYNMWKEAYPGMDDDTIAKFMAAKDTGVYSTSPGYMNPYDVPGTYTAS